MQKINESYMYISIESFQQNKLIAKQLRKDVSRLITNQSVCSIGGESCIIALSSNVKYINHYTNNKFIYKDAEYNNKFYKKIKSNNLIDYNTIKELEESDILLLNLPNLNINLMKIINNCYFKKIVLITCHADNFWKRVKILTNYNIKKRKNYTTEYSFVSVTELSYNCKFISLGGSCAISYNLKKYGFRNEAFPFDHCKIDIRKLNKVLENDFKNYENIYEYKYSENHDSILYKNEYNITFAHENITKEMLLRRINRFRTERMPIYIYLHLKKKLNINDVDKNIPKLSTLIIISNTKINYPGIIFIHLKQFEQDWKYPNINWKYIFELF